MIEILVAFVLAWLCSLSGVALGGFLVYRTKKETYEPFFPKKEDGEGKAFNVYDPLAPDNDEDEVYTSVNNDPSDILYSNSNRFAEQFAESLATKAATRKDGE